MATIFLADASDASAAPANARPGMAGPGDPEVGCCAMDGCEFFAHALKGQFDLSHRFRNA
jgi:hypothetical protein